jgi:hypothetical protein
MATNSGYVYDFTLSADKYVGNHFQLITFLKTFCKKWGFQREISKTSYDHFQGRISLNEKKRINEVNNIFHDKKIMAHISKTSTASAKASMFYNYVTKEDTRIEGPWTDKQREKYIPRQYRGKENTLLTWQKQVSDMYEHHKGDGFSDRKINVIYDKAGNNGKSTLAHLMRLHLDGVVLPPVNDGEKLCQSCCDIMMGKEIRNSVPIFIDLPRAMDKSRLYGIYSAIEVILSGYVYDVRHKYKDWDFDTPFLWVCTNIEPDDSMLSKDRWMVWTINKEKTLIPYNDCI